MILLTGNIIRLTEEDEPMATLSIRQDHACRQEPLHRDRHWEGDCYQLGCAAARHAACQRLQTLERRLHDQRPGGWQVKGWRERTLVTRFGDVRVRRRLYQDAQGSDHFLLDEYLGWEKAQVATPSLQEHMVTLASRLPFREVTRTVAGLTAGVLAPATVHRLLGRVAHKALAAEQRAWQGCLAHGEELPTEGRPIDTLYVEADGVWVHLQREGSRWYEVRSAVA
jgi:hypothetical protein